VRILKCCKRYALHAGAILAGPNASQRGVVLVIAAYTNMMLSPLYLRPGMLERRCISDRAGITAERNDNDASKTAGSHLPTAVSTTGSISTTSNTISSSTSCRKPPASVNPPHLRRRATEGLLDSSPNSTQQVMTYF
jgi:hypothetical protein